MSADAPGRLGPNPDASWVETGVCGLLLSLGLVVAAGVELYDERSGAVRLALAVLVVVVSFTLFQVALRALAVPAAVRSITALLALLPWSVLPLSQVAYIGYLLVPIEVLLSAGVLVWRARLRWPSAALAAAAVRMAVFGVVSLGHPLVRRALSHLRVVALAIFD